MQRRLTKILVASAALATLVGCGDVTAACGPSDKPALTVSAFDGGLAHPVHDVTILYDRHGDDTLSVLRDLPTAIDVPLGDRPGIYDLRVMAPGYADWLNTNVTIEAEGCDPRTAGSQIFMQKLP
jgi:hypothetical protein